MSLREMLRSSRLLRPVEDLQAPLPVKQLPVQLGQSVEAQVERRESELFWWSNFCRLELCWKMVGGQAARLLSERHFGLYWLCNCWQMW